MLRPAAPHSTLTLLPFPPSAPQFVTMHQLIDWIRNPIPKDQMKEKFNVSFELHYSALMWRRAILAGSTLACHSTPSEHQPQLLISFHPARLAPPSLITAGGLPGGRCRRCGHEER